MNDDSVDAIVEESFVEATQKARPIGLPPDCTPQNAANLLSVAREFYIEQGCLYNTHPFVLLSNKYVIPLLAGIKELIVSPHSEKEMINLLDRGFTADQVQSAKKAFVRFAGSKDISSAGLIKGILVSLDDWFSDDFSPDPQHISLLGEFLRYLANDRNSFYY